MEGERNLAQFGSKLYHVNNRNIIKNIYFDLQNLVDKMQVIRKVQNGIVCYVEKQNEISEDQQDTKNEQTVAEVESNHSNVQLQLIPKINPNTGTNKSKVELDISSESDESDGLQEFLDAFEPKKRKRKPKRKRELTEEEKKAKEKENLEKRTCKECGMIFSIRKGLQNHIRSKHTFEKPYTCGLCGEKFSVQSSYALHRRRHLGIKPHLCNICGKTFLRHTDLYIHMRTHNKVLDVKCNLCSNAYNSMTSLKKHILIKHTDPSEWKHECHICGKKCVTTTTLGLHLKQHKEDRSFKCHLCEKGFYTNQNLQVHIRTHSASTKFNCELCFNGYRSNETLQRHLLRMHGIGKEKQPSLPKYFCPVCNDGFLQRARFERHIKFHKTGEEEYHFKCKVCCRRYKDKNFFTMHMKNKHNVNINEDRLKERFDSGSKLQHNLTTESSGEQLKDLP